MRKTRFSLVALTVLMTLSACGHKIEFVDGSFRSYQAESSLSVETLSIVFPASGGSASIDLDAGGVWSAAFEDDRAADWCSLSSYQGKRGKATVTVSVKGNPDYDERSASIVITSGDLKRTIAVTQQATPALIIGQAYYQFEPEGATLSVKLASNLDLDIVIQPGCDWIVPAESKSVTERVHTFKVTRNESRSERKGWIVFKNEQQKEADTVHVAQAFHPILVPCEILKAASLGWTVSFETASPTPDDYRIVLADRWISQSGQETVDGRSRFLIEVQPQDSQGGRRSTMVFVYDKDYACPDTVRILQYEKLPSFSFTTTADNVTLPEIEGDDQAGFVFWGDGEQELLSPGISHTYTSSGPHVVSVEILSKKRVPFNHLENGMTINIRDLRR